MFNRIKLNQCTITLTRNCNLRCAFCYAKTTNYDVNKNIDFSKVKKLVDFCNEAKLRYIVFTGGEPLLYPKLVDILQYIKTKNHKIISTIATNGIKLADEEFCKELISNGIEYFDISLKGKDAIEWEKITGQDFLKTQQKAIKNLTSLNVEFTCSMVLCHSNIDSFIDTLKIAKSSGAKNFSFTFIIDNNKSSIKGIDYLKENNPLELINKFISNIDKLNEITNDWWIEYSYPLCIYTEDQLKILERRLAAPCQIHMKNGITVDTDMNIIPCNMCLDTQTGQFGKDFLTYQEYKSFIRNNNCRETMNKLRKMPSITCKRCKHKKNCYGGCPVLWRNYSFEDLLYIKKFDKQS